MTGEHDRHEAARHGEPWKQWGPYLSERQWGTVREAYSTDGNAWNYFSHDQARARAYRKPTLRADNGAGLGARHQTGWTGVVARAMHLFATSTAEQYQKLAKIAGIIDVEPGERPPATPAPIS